MTRNKHWETVETEIDKRVLTEMQEAGGNLKTFRGEFYGCQGGWKRWSDHMYNTGGESSDRSLIFRIEKP